MPVNSTHKQYTQNIKKWRLVRDCDEGSEAIKKRSKGDSKTSTLTGRPGTAYLPAPNPTDVSAENIERFVAYLERASYVNFTGHTKEGMLGLVFRKETVSELPSSIDYMKENANGGGLSSDQMIKDVSSDVLMLGRYGLLVDYPNAPEGLTEDQVRALNLRANILAYPTETIINWRTETIGGVNMLTMVVLREPTEIQVDEFEFKEVIYHRVLLLKDGIYVQNLYNEENKLIVYETGETDPETGDSLFSGDMVPLDFSGSVWNEIPFVFVGSINNDPTVDKSPLYDIAEVNIAHYRNSADYEESSFLVGQPTPVLTGLTQSWVKENFKDGIALGSRGGIMLPVGGDADLLQANENQMPLKGMETKEQQMVKIGTRLITDTGGKETMDAARMRYAGQNSKLGGIIINVQSAFIKCYEWATVFMGGTGEIKLEINKEFYDSTIDPKMIIAGIQAMDRAVIAKSDLQDLMRKGGLIKSERTNEEIDAESEETSPIV